MASTQSRTKSEPQVTLNVESVLNSGMPYANSSTGYRAIPDILLDDDGTNGSSNVVVVNRTGWNVNTCGTTQSTIAERISDCASHSIIGPESTWDGGTKGNSGQGVWKLVARSGSMSGGKGKEVWQDQRTGLLWSSLISSNLNWCKSSGSNFISGNPTAQDDPGDFCDNATYQNVGTVPAKAISACFDDGEINYTQTDIDININGKAGLGSTSVPSVYWRLPTSYDYHIAEVNGIRFVLPETLSSGSMEWTATLLYSPTRSNAVVFSTVSGAADSMSRDSNTSVRCVGR